MTVSIEPGPIRRIVVGVDGSEPSSAALAWAIGMARGMRAEVTAVFGFEIPMDFSLGFAPVSSAMFEPELRTTLKRLLENEWTSPLKESGLPHQVLMRDGRPATVIIEAADEVEADIVVVGRRGRGGVAELLLGSVSHEVALHGRRPVLLIS